MITILAVIVCGVILVVGVLCLIIAFNSTEQKKAKEMMAMVKYSGKKMDLVTLPDGTTAAVPKKFDPHFVMEQLANIQNSPNIISAYVDCLIAKFRTGREIAYINKIQEYYIALGSGMETQLKLVELEEAFEHLTDIENRALRKQISREKLERDLAKIKAETERFKNIGTKQRQEQKTTNDPYSKAYNQAKRKIDHIRGRQDAVEAVKQEREVKVQNILRGRSRDEVSSYEKEEILKIERYYGTIIDQL